MVNDPLASSAVGTAFAIIWGIVIVSWIVMFAVMIGILIIVTLMRGRRARQRQSQNTPEPAVVADPRLPQLLDEVRRADPDFDEQLLLEAAQMACMVMFAATSTGDEQAMRQMAAPSFWRTFFGRYITTTARDARRQQTIDQRRSSRYARFPVDYQASVPELMSLELGPQQRARVRVRFNQLRLILAPGAAGEVAMASATSLGSLAVGLGGAVAERANAQSAQTATASGLAWVAWSGQYDLDFVRPGDARTDPGAALASRTCTRCGATYRSELTTVCEHCGAQRPLAWGQWLLTDIAAAG